MAIMEIGHRPFCIEPVSNLMLPDGIFDSAIYNLDIGFYIRNNSNSSIRNVEVKIDWDGQDASPWAYKSNKEFVIDEIPANGNYLCRVPADFRGVSAGKYGMTISYGTYVFYGGSLAGEFYSEQQNIFVSETTYDEVANCYSCKVPEGEMRLNFGRRFYFPPVLSNKYHHDDGNLFALPAIPIPVEISASVFSNEGSEKQIPFNDPWWKVIAAIIAAIAAIAALIAASEGEGTAMFGISGEGQDDPTDYDVCVPDPDASGDPDGLAGYLSIIASVALRVALADDKDPWQRGREHFVGGPHGVETVEASIKPPKRIKPGENFKIPVDWVYRRITSANEVEELSVSETRSNPHALGSYSVSYEREVPKSSPIDIVVNLTDSDGTPLSGRDILGSVAFVPPNSKLRVIRVPLLDYEAHSGMKLPDGTFHARLNTDMVASSIGSEAIVGRWRAMIYIQNTNMVPMGTDPFFAATTVGGDFLAGPREITFPEEPISEEDRPDESKHCPYDDQIDIAIDVLDS